MESCFLLSFEIVIDHSIEFSVPITYLLRFYYSYPYFVFCWAILIYVCPQINVFRRSRNSFTSFQCKRLVYKERTTGKPHVVLFLEVCVILHSPSTKGGDYRDTSVVLALLFVAFFVDRLYSVSFHFSEISSLFKYVLKSFANVFVSLGYHFHSVLQGFLLVHWLFYFSWIVFVYLLISCLYSLQALFVISFW